MPEEKVKVPVPVKRIEKRLEAEVPLRRREELPEDWRERMVQRRWKVNPRATRVWRGFDVDVDLRNEWLKDINSISAFQIISVCSGHPSAVHDKGQSPHFTGIPTWLQGDSQAVIKIGLKIKAEIERLSPTSSVDLSFWTSGPNAGIIWDEYGHRRHTEYPQTEALWKKWEHLIDNVGISVDSKIPNTAGNVSKIEKWWETTPSIVRSVLAKYKQRVPVAKLNPSRSSTWVKKRIKQAGGLEKVIGYFLIAEAGVSIAASQDQRTISTVGRIARILSGVWLVRRK